MGGGSRQDFTEQKRAEIVQNLLLRSVRVGDKVELPLGAITEVARSFDCAHGTVSKLWSRAVPDQDVTRMVSEFKSRRHGRCGRKPTIDKETLVKKIKAIPIKDRKNIRVIAHKIGISSSYLCRLYKRLSLRKCRVKSCPMLSNAKMYKRLNWAVQHTNENGLVVDMDIIVHVDEKWFYVEHPNAKQSVYLFPNENTITSQKINNLHPTKVLFVCAVARPRWDEDKGEWFDGKLGCWPVLESQVTKRSSRNRPAGVTELVPITITREWYKDFVITKLVPAIKEKWPRSSSKNIIVQHDNARPHVPADDVDVVQAGKAHGWSIRLKFQPPSSPDLNVLDLGFFRVIQHLQMQIKSTNVDTLVKATLEAWERCSYQTLLMNWRTLQFVIREVIGALGGNSFKLPHVGKMSLERHGLLPDEIPVDASALKLAVDHLKNEDRETIEGQLSLEISQDIAIYELGALMAFTTIDEGTDENILEMVEV